MFEKLLYRRHFFLNKNNIIELQRKSSQLNKDAFPYTNKQGYTCRRVLGIFRHFQAGTKTLIAEVTHSVLFTSMSVLLYVYFIVIRIFFRVFFKHFEIGYCSPHLQTTGSKRSAWKGDIKILSNSKAKKKKCDLLGKEEKKWWRKNGLSKDALSPPPSSHYHIFIRRHPLISHVIFGNYDDNSSRRTRKTQLTKMR